MNVDLAVFFRKYWSVLLLTGIVATFVAVGATYLLSPVYVAKVRLMVMPRDDAQAGGAVVNARVTYAQTQSNMVVTPEVVERTVTALKLDRDPSALGGTGLLSWVKQVLRDVLTFAKYGYVKRQTPLEAAAAAVTARVRAQVVEESNVVEIEADWRDPKIAARLADEVAAQFVAASRKTNEAELRRMLADIEAGFASREQALREATERLTRFRVDHGLSAQDDGFTSVALQPAEQSELVVLQKQVAAAENDLNSVHELYRGTESRLLTKQGQIRLLGAAGDPPYPARPVKLLYGAVGFLAGVLIGLAVATYLDTSNKVIYTLDDARNAVAGEVADDDGTAAAVPVVDVSK